jgi:hypothetical protein
MEHLKAALPSFLGTLGALLLLVFLTVAYASYAGETTTKIV